MIKMVKGFYFFLNKMNRRQFFFLFAFLGFYSFSFSQKTSGRLTGKITDASTNQPVSNVNIIDQKTKRGVTSITDGTYILSLEEGTYKIQFSYSGYQAKEISGVVIKAGQTTYLDVVLETAVKQNTGVIVTTTVKKEAQSSLYSAQKRSAAASDGISQEAIAKTPDNNASQILKRVVGVNIQDNRFVVVRGLNDQYNQTMMNGVPMTSTETNRNAFSFSLIPAAVIDNITINKTATPDMPGNFAGGVVQVNTKDFPSKDFFSVTRQTGFSDDTYGKSFYGDKKNFLSNFGFAEKGLDLPKGFPTGSSEVPIFYLNPQERSRYLKMLKNDLEPFNMGPSGLNSGVQLGYGKTINWNKSNQTGIIAAITQRKTELFEEEIVAKDPVFSLNLNPDTLSGLGYYSENNRYRYTAEVAGVLNVAQRFGNSKISLKNLYSQVLNSLFIYRPLVRFTSSDIFNLPNRYVGYTYLTEQKNIFNTILSGEHRTGKNNETRLEWNVNATFNKTKTPDTRNFVFEVEDSTKGILAGNSVNSNFSYPQMLTGSSRAWSDNKDFIYGGAFNVTSPFSIKSNKQLFKSGILFQNRKRDATGTVLPIEGVPHTTVDKIFAPENYYPGGEDVNIGLVAAASTSSLYKATSNLLALYESIENRIGNNLRVIWGLRIEDYQQSISVYTPLYIRNFREPLEKTVQFGARNTFNFLPSVNIIYSPVVKINIRLAYSNTVIRPELKDLASFARYDYETFSLTQGNQYLKSASIRNFDLKLEWFPSSGEIVSFSAFYKQLKDPIEYAKGKTGTEGYNRFRIPVNAGDGYVKGLEMEIRKRLGFIAPWLDNFTLFGNGALLDSKVSRKEINNDYFTYVGEHSFTGQANYIINSGMSVQLFKSTFEATVSYNRTGDYINELGSSDYLRKLPNGNYAGEIPPYKIKARNILDLVIAQSLWKNKFNIKANASNLLRTRYILYQDIDGNGKFDTPAVFIDKYSSYQNYRGGIDNTASNIKPQRTYSLSITYTF